MKGIVGIFCLTGEKNFAIKEATKIKEEEVKDEIGSEKRS